MSVLKPVLFMPATVAFALRDTTNYSFVNYVAEFGKTYSDTEHATRRGVFESRLAEVNNHNEEYKMGKQTWWMAVNEFTDMHEHELATFKTGKATHRVHDHPFQKLGSNAKQNPSSVDWRAQSVVTPVKNQGGCGSCWAFSAIEVVESHYMIATGERDVKFAPQAYVNCVQNPDSCGGTGGCEGATMELAFNMTVTRGVPLESDLPYQGSDETCIDYPAAAKCDGYVKVAENDAQALETAIAENGPVSVTVAANWFSYGGGIYDGGCTATSCSLNHGVVAVGYTQDSWIVRNSWGQSWGEQGYIRLTRSHDLETFEDNKPSDGVACKPYPTQQIVGGESGILFDTSFPVNVHKVQSTVTV